MGTAPSIASVSGYKAVKNGGITADDVLTLDGTGVANSIVTVFDGTMQLGTAEVNNSGAWTFTTDQLSEGTQTFTATDTTAGSVSSASSPFNATVETLSGGAPASIGVNMDGAEYSWGNFPSLADLEYVKSEGVNLVRLPIAWEMMQSTLNGPLNSTYLAGLENFLSNAASLGVQVVVDLHDGGTYNLNWAADAAANYGIVAPDASDASVLGSAAVPISAFANFWQQLATALDGNPAVAGYDIMNEPNNMPSPSTWPDAAQAAVNAIRSVDMNTPIIVEGNDWASAQNWPYVNPGLQINDPANDIVYEAHQYFDNGSGTYPVSYAQSGDTANTGVQEVAPFLQWLQENDYQGYIGELGIPSDNSTISQWLPLLNNVLNTLQASGVSATVWNFEMPDATTPSWWVSTFESSVSANMNIAPFDGQINPVMALIFEHSAPTITSTSSDNGGILTLTGLGAGDATVYVYDGQTLLGTTTTSVSGAWSFTTPTLANGVQTFTATDADSSGDISETSSAFAVTVAIDPTVTSVVATGSGITSGIGDLDAGNVVTLTLNLNEAVTVAGGTPTLTLNDGGIATYSGGSGSTALTFSYTVAAGQNTADLSATAVNLNAATVTDATGNAANLAGALTNPAGTLQIDTTAPTVSSLVASGSGITGGTGDLDAGKTVTLTLNLSEVVTVAGGTPTLTLNDGGTATYIGGSGSNALTFSYTVAAGQNTADLSATAVNLNAATVTDAAGNAANLAGALTSPAGTLQIDTTAPTVSSLVASGSGITGGTGDLNAGKTVTLTLNMSSAVTVAGGTPTLSLNDGGTATYIGGSGSNALTFSYTVAAGQNTADLSATAVNLNAATVTDAAGNAANLAGALTSPAGTLQIDTTAPTVSSLVASGSGITGGTGDLDAGKTVTLTLTLSEVVTVAGGTPTLTLNDGGTATYIGGSGSNALTFSYTVAAGQNTADLSATAVNLNAATVTDAAGNAANLAGALTNPAGTLQIDTTAPTVSSLVASGTGITGGTGDLNAGKTVTLTLNLSEAVTVAGGTPTLTLNDGGTATYTGGSGSNALTFSYTVAAGQNTADLSATAVNLNAAIVTDAAGNAANLAGALTNPAGTLQIDTTLATPQFTLSESQGENVANDQGSATSATLVGTAVANSTVIIYDGSTQLGVAAVNASGAWSFATGTLTNGTYSFTVQDTDAVGDTSSMSAAQVLTVSGTHAVAGHAPSNTLETDGSGVGAGNGASPSPTDLTQSGPQADTTAPAAPVITNSTSSGNETVTLSGTAEANSTVTIYDGQTALGTTTASASGAWNFTTPTLADGVQTFTATDTDSSGNISETSSAFAVTVDPLAPIIANAVVNLNHSITLGGSAEADSTVTIYDGQTALGTTTASASGAWNFTTPTLVDGVQTFTATDADPSGDISETSSAFAVTVAPSAPIIANDVVNLNNTVTLSGSAEADSTVTIYDGQIALGTTTASANGAWTYTSGALQSGAQTFTATATDDGGTSALSNAIDPIISKSSGTGTPQSAIEPGVLFGTHGGFFGTHGVFFGSQPTLGYLPNGNSAGATASPAQGMQGANIALLGSYMASTFATVSDYHGTPSLFSEPSHSASQSPLTNPHHA